LLYKKQLKEYIAQLVEHWTFNPQVLGSIPCVLKNREMAGVELNFYLLNVAIALFHIGMLGLVLNRENILKTIMSLEILLLAINLIFITFSLYLDDLIGHIFVLFILVLSATESSIGLSILAVFYEQRNNIILDPIKINNQNLKT
jgi:NADH-quinone oxidoreductase subunit K